MATIDIHRVSKAYGATPILHDLSVSVREGEFLTLVGPSGCGKSTLLRMIAGLETVTNGVIRIGERVVNHLPPKQRDVALVFQNYALYPHMTVAENMGFSLRISGTPKAEIRRRVEEAAAILDLTPLLARHPKQLSGGQRQRVAMGRAIVRDPQVFLFDEPLSNLDAKLRVAMRAEIKALHQRLGTTIVYVTHDQVEAMTMADRIVVMRGGKIEQIGAPLDLYERPDNLFVASFIGSPAMNLLPVTVTAGRLVTDDGLTLPMPPQTGLTEGQALIYGIRPEHFSRGAGALAEDIMARVEVVEPTGAETHLRLRFGAQVITAIIRDGGLPKPGDQISLSIDGSKAILFDPVSTARVA